jgi:hypothetical protein
MKIAARMLLLILISLTAAWFIVKPIRVTHPAVFGITCFNEVVCLDDASKLEEAQRLYAESANFVSDTVGSIEGSPKVIFCSSVKCNDAFGLGARSAVTFGRMGTVIAHNSWHSHIVRHELIHFLQYERLGVLRVLLMPDWIIEGMAYSMSLDSRSELEEPWQHYRSKFSNWYGSIDKNNLWKLVIEY